jgi:hypothetical protein
MCSNIPASPAYGVYMSQLIRYARCSSNYSDFLKRHLHLRNRLLDQGYKKIRLIRSLKKFIFRYRYKSKNDVDEAVSVVSLTSSSGGYSNGRNSANLELLIDKTSSIYLYVKLKALAFVITLICLLWRDTVSAGRQHTNGYELCPSSSRFILLLI